MEINLDTAAIQDAVVRAITDSAIGEQVKAVIENELTAKAKSWDSDTIIQSAIKNEVRILIGKILREEIESRKEEIKKLVAPQLNDEILHRMGASILDVMLGNLSRN